MILDAVRLVLQELRRRVKQPWKSRQRSDLDKRDLRRSQMCSTAISNVQYRSESACLSRSENYAKGPPEAPSPIFAFGFAELAAAPLGTTFRGADALAARCLGCPRGVGAFGGCLAFGGSNPDPLLILVRLEPSGHESELDLGIRCHEPNDSKREGVYIPE